jgi:phosphoserine phosphatase
MPSFKAGKITSVEECLESIGMHWGSFDKTWFYSDSLNDLPLLKIVTHPVAVDPDDTLRAHAEQAGWPVLALNRSA